MGRPNREPKPEPIDRWMAPWETWTLVSVALFLGAAIGWWVGVAQ